MAITTGHKLLSASWTTEVEAAEAAIRRYASQGTSTANCHVAFFEVAGDGRLHVNVTHRHATNAVGGWAGPGILRDGFVHNRRFTDVQSRQMTRHIREMVFAAPA